jgi:hypothetical protein
MQNASGNKKERTDYMKNSVKLALLAAFGLTTAPLTLWAQADDATPPAPQGTETSAGRRPNPGAHLLALLDKYDTNHDGQLDKSELAAMKKDIQENKIARPPGRPAGRGLGGPNGGGERDSAAGLEAGPQRPPAPEKLLAKFDADKDGKLDAAELTALLKDLQSHRPQMGGMRGGDRMGGRGHRQGGEMPPHEDGPAAE